MQPLPPQLELPEGELLLPERPHYVGFDHDAAIEQFKRKWGDVPSSQPCCSALAEIQQVSAQNASLRSKNRIDARHSS